MPVVRNEDLCVALDLLDMALGGQFCPGGLLDRYANEMGLESSDLADAGRSVDRLAKAAGRVEGGWGEEDIHWR